MQIGLESKTKLLNPSQKNGHEACLGPGKAYISISSLEKIKLRSLTFQSAPKLTGASSLLTTTEVP